jgi:glycosyltransferase involved in cell wall biosynthesis
MKASIVIPCHNSARFIGETAESAFAQTLADLEVVFVDDGSSDGTRDLIRRAIAEHPERAARLICQEDSGLAAARNRGIAEARGRYILPLDSDDLLDPRMVADCAAILDGDESVALVYTDREDFGDVQQIFSVGGYELGRLKYFNQIGYSSLYRRSVWEAIGGYRVNVSGLDDWDFWVAAALRGFRGHHLAAPHLKHRTRAGSLMTRIVRDYQRFHARIVLNNREAYSHEEARQAERFLATGAPAPFLRAAHRIFLLHFPATSTTSS